VTGRPNFSRGDLGPKHRTAALSLSLFFGFCFVCFFFSFHYVSQCGVGAGWVWADFGPLAGPRPLPPRSAVVRSPHFPVWGNSGRRSRFRSCQRQREGGGARGGRGPLGPRPGPRPQASCTLHTRLAWLPAAYCAPRSSLARSLSSLARRPPDGRAGAGDPSGPRLLAGGPPGPGRGLLAMSSARDASSQFPLHLLVWNNDYRQLEKELRGQVRCGVEGVGGRLASLNPFPARAPGAQQMPSTLRS
jgi:hypothetical protein